MLIMMVDEDVAIAILPDDDIFDGEHIAIATLADDDVVGDWAAIDPLNDVGNVGDVGS